MKSLQLAAVAAKKVRICCEKSLLHGIDVTVQQQEEMDKKAARLKEMENRRQQALQRKMDEEKARALEQDRKLKEDGERRKREREDNTGGRLLRTVAKKV